METLTTLFIFFPLLLLALIGISEGIKLLKNKLKNFNKQQSYSEEEVESILKNFRTEFIPFGQVNDLTFKQWFEQFKKK